MQGTKGNFLKLIKDVYETSTVYTILSGATLNDLKINFKIRILFSLLLFRIEREVQARKRNKSIGKEKIEVLPLAHRMIIYIENLMTSTKKLLEERNKFIKVSEYKVNI